MDPLGELVAGRRMALGSDPLSDGDSAEQAQRAGNRSLSPLPAGVAQFGAPGTSLAPRSPLRAAGLPGSPLPYQQPQSPIPGAPLPYQRPQSPAPVSSLPSRTGSNAAAAPGGTSLTVRLPRPRTTTPRKVEIARSEMIIGEELGRGTFGVVYKAVCRSTEVAVKIPKKQSFSNKELAAFRKEVKLMSQINHPNVCLFLGACTEAGSIAIVTELLVTDLNMVLHHSKEGQKPSLSQRIQWAKQTAQGLTWLHQTNPPLIHRDIKPANVLLTEEKIAKICDFGMAQFLLNDGCLFESRIHGTPLYMSPEVMLKERVTKASDVYSFGICLWEMLTCEKPFAHHSQWKELVFSVTQQDERPLIPTDAPHALSALIRDCWEADPDMRPEMREVVERLRRICVACVDEEESERIRSRLPEPGSASFWKGAFGCAEQVPWTEFCQRMVTHLNFPFTIPYGQEISEETCVLHCVKEVLELQDSFVTIQNFSRVVNHFGPFDAHFPNRVRGILQCNFFHGNMKTEQAAAILSATPVGSFLLRFSNRRANSFTLSVKKEDSVRHIVLEHDCRSGACTVNQQSFPSVLEAINQLAVRLALRSAVESTRYIHLFRTIDSEDHGYSITF